MTRFSSSLLAALLCVCAAPAGAETLRDVFAASPGQRVYDFVGALSQAARARLRTRLQGMKKNGSADGVVVVVRRVEGDSIERFASRIKDRWELGTPSHRNGMVLLVAIEQRRWRIATGSGLRKRLSDQAAEHLMKSELVPQFRRKRYEEGLNSALIALQRQALAKPGTSAPATAGSFSDAAKQWETPPASQVTDGIGAVLIVLALIVVAPILVLGALAGSRGGSANRNDWNNGNSWMSSSNDSSSSGSSGWSSGGGDSGGSSSGGDGGGSCGGDGGAGGSW